MTADQARHQSGRAVRVKADEPNEQPILTCGGVNKEDEDFSPPGGSKAESGGVLKEDLVNQAGETLGNHR